MEWALLSRVHVQYAGQGLVRSAAWALVYRDGTSEVWVRRTLEKYENIRSVRVDSVMTKHPRSIAPDRLAVEAVQLLEKHALGGRLVVLGPGERLLGAVTFHDLLAAGVV